MPEVAPIPLSRLTTLRTGGEPARLIDAQSVRSHAMPPGNLTGMEAEERLALARWISSAEGYRP